MIAHISILLLSILAVAPIPARAAIAFQTAGTLYAELKATDASAGTAVWTNHAGGRLGNFAAAGTPQFVADVDGTGLPGAYFNGASAYNSFGVTDNQLDGAAARTVEVWAYNPTVEQDEALVSWGHRGTGDRNWGFNYANSSLWGALTVWGPNDMGWTGGSSYPTKLQWHHLVVTYDGATQLKVYADGSNTNSRTLSGALDTFPGEFVTIGAMHETTNGTLNVFFTGYINGIRIHSGVLNATQILKNYQLGPYIPITVTTYADLRATHATAGQATWVNQASNAATALGNFVAVAGTPSRVSDPTNASNPIPAVLFNASVCYSSSGVAGAKLSGGAPRTIEALVYDPERTQENTVVSIGHRGVTRSNFALNYGTNPSWGAFASFNEDFGWGATPNASFWHYLAWTYDGWLTVKTYVDGIADNSTTLSGRLTTFADEFINIGCQRDNANGTVNNNQLFHGYISVVRIHSGVLSAAQVATNYADLMASFVPTSPPAPSTTSSTTTGTGVGDALNGAASLRLSWQLLALAAAALFLCGAIAGAL